MVYRHLRLKHFAVSPRVWIPQRRIRKSSPLDHLKAAATERQFEPVCRLQMMASDLASLLGQKCITLGFQQWIQVQYRPLLSTIETSLFSLVLFSLGTARHRARWILPNQRLITQWRRIWRRICGPSLVLFKVAQAKIYYSKRELFRLPNQ